MLSVAQRLPNRGLNDLASSVRTQLRASHLTSIPKPGGRIAIGVGSRGLANLPSIVHCVVDYWRDAGFHPFIFPAMGSHGAATAEGQAAVLAGYGIDEGSMGCPVISSLDVVPLGQTAEGIEVYIDRQAFESDGLMLINRVKWHTDFNGKLESGLFKMMAIGMGKLAGARQYHNFAYHLGLEQVIRAVGRKVLSTGKIIGGLAILEDALHHTAHVEAISHDNIEQREAELLALTKSWKARIPVNRLDLLIIDEIGKDISGTGMDTKVVNRNVHGSNHIWPDAGCVLGRIFVRNLTDGTHGNATGIGIADVVHDRILPKANWRMTAINCLTALAPMGARLPVHFSSDRECIEQIASTVGKLEMKTVTIGWIRNTLELSRLMLSENLREEIEANSNLAIVGPARDLPFDAKDDLPPTVPVALLHQDEGRSIAR